ncbi:hypothetical protein PR202_gb01243 [Eleusine coracana subsp. coracana]|uniref:Uncharacterized protein n=1 Tax=Eleusine coracana subsp. coracana TaxID=191504 RepID=A0AAV5DVL1_ELECO|nr:hypothetical protein PR202_gb01243 [Eleusine coracana subsp. coracana]
MNGARQGSVFSQKLGLVRVFGCGLSPRRANRARWRALCRAARDVSIHESGAGCGCPPRCRMSRMANAGCCGKPAKRRQLIAAARGVRQPASASQLDPGPLEQPERVWHQDATALCRRHPTSPPVRLDPAPLLTDDQADAAVSQRAAVSSPVTPHRRPLQQLHQLVVPEVSWTLRVLTASAANASFIFSSL